jgi:hypothetical protein
MISRTLRPFCDPRLYGLDGLTRLESLRRDDVRGRDVADVHVVAHVGAVGGVVVVAVDLRGLAGEQLLEHDREEVVRARVVHRRVGRADDVEVAQRRVAEGLLVGCRRDALIAQQPFADELRLAVRRRGALGKVLGHQRHVRVP